ncbi:unnamed protein product [Anisakis simplex]|uniref:Uncharacterized protein n=1 Tax=Anisakis simplex TaxID=6269 RepID=A0A0M3KAF4_ANISI|nr:unnamed protein product [Anisakis simplex]
MDQVRLKGYTTHFSTSNMVREKNRQRCSNPIVQRFLNDQSLGYVAIDDHVKRLFYEQYMEPLDSLLDWMMHQKENAKQIILHKSGQKRIPKTPQRNNYMMRVKSSFDSRKKELLTSHTSGFTNEEDDDQPSSRVHTAIRKQNIQKVATPKSIPKRIKQEVISPPVNDLSHLPVHLSRDHVSRITEASPSRFRALTRKDLKSPDLFSSPNKTLTPSRIPGYGASSASRYQQSAITKPNQSPYVEAVKAVIAEQKTRNSEYVREIERKAKTVISNREEIIKERAERVKR